MRIAFVLLLLANIALFGYTRLDQASDGEGMRLSQQINPERIKLLTPQQVAALGPSKMAALADVCIEWGPFNDTDRARALADVDPATVRRLLSQKRVDTNATHWVFLPRNSSKAATDRRVGELKSAGLKEVSVVDAGALRYTISLGAFRSEDAANAFVAELAKQGITDAKAAARTQPVVWTSLVIRDPEASMVARLRTLQAAYPGSEVKIGACDKPT
jgi:hypothetical protein